MSGRFRTPETTVRNRCCVRRPYVIWQLNPDTNKLIPYRVYNRNDRPRFPVLIDRCCCVSRKLAFGNRVYDQYRLRNRGSRPLVDRRGGRGRGRGRGRRA